MSSSKLEIQQMYTTIAHPPLQAKLPGTVLVRTAYLLAAESPWGQDPNVWDENDNYAVMAADGKKILSVGITPNEAVSRAIFLWSRQ